MINGDTPLHVAVSIAAYKDKIYQSQHDLEKIEALMLSAADVNARNNHTHTPLEQGKRTDVRDLLLIHGAKG